MWLFDVLFPRTSRRIQAPANLGRAQARRILVTATADDRVTPIELSRAVAWAADASRTRLLEIDGVDHLELFAASEEYRTALLETLDGPADVEITSRGAKTGKAATAFVT